MAKYMSIFGFGYGFVYFQVCAKCSGFIMYTIVPVRSVSGASYGTCLVCEPSAGILHFAFNCVKRRGGIIGPLLFTDMWNSSEMCFLGI